MIAQSFRHHYDRCHWEGVMVHDEHCIATVWVPVVCVPVCTCIRLYYIILLIFVPLDRDTCSALAVPWVSKVSHCLLQVHLIARDESMSLNWRQHLCQPHSSSWISGLEFLCASVLTNKWTFFIKEAYYDSTACLHSLIKCHVTQTRRPPNVVLYHKTDHHDWCLTCQDKSRSER